MSEPIFTSAPWHKSDDISDPCYIVGSKGRAICSIKYHEPYDEADANAHLIAAAPDLCDCLLEACAEMCHNLSEDTGYCRYLDREAMLCRQLDGECFVQKWLKTLAKARGEVVK